MPEYGSAPAPSYGAITRLEEQRGWIRPVESGGRRRPYAITGAGKLYLEEQLALLDQVQTAMRRIKTCMKTMVRWAARLDPPRGANGSGVEFEALLEDVGPVLASCGTSCGRHCVCRW